MQAALNKQINEEAASAYIYLSMAAYFESINMTGFAHWMTLQAKEELAHVMRIYGHIVERGGRVLLTEIAAPPTEWASVLEAYQAAYKHECHITKCIHDLVELAQAEKDHAAGVMLQWFVAEQVEEEAAADEWVQKLTLAQDAPNALLMLDRAAAARE